jgi:hypothetical protein
MTIRPLIFMESLRRLLSYSIMTICNAIELWFSLDVIGTIRPEARL